MKSCPKMQAIIEQLAQRLEVDLTQASAHFRLDMPGFDRLCVENIGFNRLSVAHYFEQLGDLVPDPEIVFIVGNQDLGWIPVEITQAIGGWRRYVEVSGNGRQLTVRNKCGQRGLAEFAEMWAQNIQDQGWLERGVKYENG